MRNEEGVPGVGGEGKTDEDRGLMQQEHELTGTKSFLRASHHPECWLTLKPYSSHPQVTDEVIWRLHDSPEATLLLLEWHLNTDS